MPIYEAELRLVVTEKVGRELAREPFKMQDQDDFAGCAAYRGHQFAIILDPGEGLTRVVVSHECFHITHRIMEWYGNRFDVSNYESFAALNGWINNWVSGKLGRRVR